MDIVISSIIGIIIIIVSIFVINQAKKDTNIGFEKKISDHIYDINQGNKNMFDASNVLSRNSNRMKNDIESTKNKNKELNKWVDSLKITTQEYYNKLNIYKTANDKNINDINYKLKNNDSEFISLSTNNLSNSTTQQENRLNVLKNNNIVHDEKLNDIVDLNKENNDILKNNRALGYDIGGKMMSKYSLNNYIDNKKYNDYGLEYNKSLLVNQGKLNELDAIYENRDLLASTIDIISKHKNEMVSSQLRIKKIENDYVPKHQIKRTKFPVSNPTANVKHLEYITMIKNSRSATDSIINNEVPRKYVNMSTYNNVKNTTKNISYPMIDFTGDKKINIKGSISVGTNNFDNKLTVKDNKVDSWAGGFQNDKCKIALSKGDGNGMQISTDNQDYLKTALQINNKTDIILNANNTGNVDMAQELNSKDIKSTSQICINNTCVNLDDIKKIEKIYVEPPRFIPTSTILLVGIHTINLNNHFKDKTNNLTFKLVNQVVGDKDTPTKNDRANINQTNGILTIYGGLRGIQYNVVVEAENMFGGKRIGYFNIKEDIIQDCIYDDWSDWSTCNPVTGSRFKTRVVKIEARNGGKACSTNPLDYKIVDDKCPIDCISSSEYGVWGPCNKDLGKRFRYKTELQAAKNGGAACTNMTDEEPCDVNCELSTWSPCNKSCDGGMQYRTVTVEPKNKGTPCGPTSQACNTHRCPPPSTMWLKGGRSGQFCADDGHEHDDWSWNWNWNWNDRYGSSHKYVTCNRGAVGPWERFQVQHLGNNQIRLIGGKENSLCYDDEDRVRCSRFMPGRDSGVFYNRNYNNRFRENNNDQYNRSVFTYSYDGDRIILKGGRAGLYCADDSDGVIRCNRSAIGPWEKFWYGPA